MKKLIAVVLIMVLLVPAIALSEERDPIIGAWYMFYDFDTLPEFASNFPGYNRLISVYIFNKDGTISCLELAEQNEQNTPTFTAAGKWGKEGNQYSFSIIGFGTGSAYIKNNELQIGTQESHLWIKLRHLDFFDPYSDFTYQ